MKARITCDKDHALGKLYEQAFDMSYYSRSTGFNVNDREHIKEFLKETNKFDLTINLTRGQPFGQVNLLMSLDRYCNENNIEHRVLSIGSYVGTILMNHLDSSYDVEKMALKLAHREAAYKYMFFYGKLDSYLINVNYLEKLSEDIELYHTHINTITLQKVLDNSLYMLDKEYTKENILY
jgi:hypothetical protein